VMRQETGTAFLDIQISNTAFNYLFLVIC